MKIYGRSLTAIASLIVVALAVTLAAHKDRNTLAYGQQQSAGDPDLPWIEFANADDPATAQKAKKRRHGLRQDKSIAELPGGIEPLPMPAYLWARLPAMPVAESNAVVLGDVTDRRAILTDDKLGIYSEFSIRLTKIFKDDQGLLRVGGVVEASRKGGAVRFPSGKIQRYTVSRQGYPQKGKIYVLFLKRDEEGDFSIVTGYELSSAGVSPLDGDGGHPENDLQFGIYRGVSEQSFLNELQKALTATIGGGD